MTVGLNDRRTGPTLGNGSQTSFPYDFKIYTVTDIQVWVRDTVTGVVTLKAYPTHYTLTGVGTDAGGDVVFVTAPTSTEEVLRLGGLPNLMDENLLIGDVFFEQSLQNSIDKLAMLVQQLGEKVTRSLVVAKFHAPTGGYLELPRPTTADIAKFITLLDDDPYSLGYAVIPPPSVLTDHLLIDNQKELRLGELDPNGDQYVALRAAAAMAANYVITLPAAAPGATTILQHDASGVYSWIPTPAGGGGGGSIVVEEDNVTVVAAATTLNFSTGLDVSAPGGGQADIVIDPGEISHDALQGFDPDKHFSRTAVVAITGLWTFDQNTALEEFILFRNAGAGVLSVSIDGDFMLERGANDYRITCAAPTAARVATFPDATGTVTLLGNAATGTGNVVLATSPVIATLSITGNALLDNQAELRLQELDASGANFIALRAPGTLGADWTMTLPISAPEDGQVMIGKAGTVTYEWKDRRTQLGGTFMDPTGTRTVVIGRIAVAGTALKVQAYRAGGTAATVQVKKNGTNMLSSALTTSTDAWASSTAFASTALAVDDSISISIESLTGTPTEIAIQLEWKATG